MAKLNGKRFHEVAKVAATKTVDEGTPDEWTGRRLWALRSDGTVLSRVTGEYGSGYSVVGKLRAGRPVTEATLREVVENAGWVIE